ncbi:response regulator [Polymorphobacter multimanifer]|nr:response regulator [Polymorphobacter multimanifer]
MDEQLTVLIVEDEALVMIIAQEELEDAGFLVLTACDADEAMRHLESDARIDVLFTDIRFPGALDGWAVAQRARAFRPGIRVVYATGYSASRPDSVPDSVLFIKPYRLSDIIDAIRRLGEPGLRDNQDA